MKDSEFTEFVGQIKEQLGRIEERLEVVFEVRAKLEAHVGDDDAHGARGHRRAWDTIWHVIAGAGAVAGIIVALVKLYRA